MIVSFSVDKDRMMATVTWLGFRHVRYGVRPHHIPIMGQVIRLPCASCAFVFSSLRALFPYLQIRPP
jgi:hypothetical protein